MISKKKINVFMILCLGLAIPVYYKAKAFIQGNLNLDHLTTLGLFFDFLFGLGIAAIAVLGHDRIAAGLKKRFPRKTDDVKRFAMQFVFSTACAFAALSLFSYIFFEYVLPFEFTPPKDLYLDLFVMGLFIPVSVNGLKESLYYYGEWENEVLHKEQLQKENIRAQYEILKNQINPHFLFNCFNTLSELAHEDKNLTIRFVHQLSQVYRFVLENKDEEVVGLKNELEVLESYIFLLKIRFGDNLHVSMENIDRFGRYGIVPLTLQILMENALKHNVVSKAHPLTIEIAVSEDDKLVFKNNLQRKSSVQTTHIGLQNIIKRYRAVANRTVDIMETSSEFVVKVPLIQVDAA